MEKLSVVLITLNAGKHLDQCLSKCGFADEIVVVDSGSTDDTLEIARRHGARIVHQDWLGFGKQRQVSVRLARNDWVLCLDADEWLTPELTRSIQIVLEAPKYQAYRMARSNRFMGRYLRHGEGYPDRCIRLFHRGHAAWSDQIVHEQVIPESPPGMLQGDLMHDKPDSLEDFFDHRPDQYTSLQALELYQAGEKVGYLGLIMKPAVRFVKFYFLRQGFREGLPGLIYVIVGCYSVFVKYAKLIDLNRLAPKNNS